MGIVLDDLELIIGSAGTEKCTAGTKPVPHPRFFFCINDFEEFVSTIVTTFSSSYRNVKYNACRRLILMFFVCFLSFSCLSVFC